MSDIQVELYQIWLNQEYGGHSQWNTVAEDGKTGWQTIYGLIRGLQIELGIAQLSDNFGTGTMSAFISQYGAVSASTSNPRIVRLVQASLWCKGYFGGYTAGTFDDSVQASIQSVTTALGLAASSSVSPKVLRSLMSMDAYTLIGGGSQEKRAVQQWLNGKYSHRSGFPLLPCDGLFSRGTQQGMMFAIQYELGMSDSVANGNFGPGTKSGLQANATVSLGSTDGNTNWVRLFQGALRMNDYDAPLTGAFDAATQTKTLSFQEHSALPASGVGNFTTWASLLVSTGDETRPGIASDMATQLTAAHCSLLYANGYRTVGRYLSVLTKRYTSGEIQRIFAAGLKTFPIMQEANTSASDFSYEKGRDHGFQALRRLRQLGFAAGTTVFFAVDFDGLDDQITAYVLPYFRGVRDVIHSTQVDFRVGVYGTRNVCSRVIADGGAVTSFVADMSWGWSGNLGFKLPNEWSYDQIAGLTLSGNGVSLPIDKNIQSSTAEPVGPAGVLPTPEPGGEFDESYFWYLTELSVRAEMCDEPSATGRVADNYVLHFLQKPTYWTGGDGSADVGAGDYWTAYTPLPEWTSGMPSAMRNAISTGRSAFEAEAPSPPTPHSGRLAHWAATTQAYRTYSGLVPATGGSVTISDLGGWALDLVQAWNACVSAGAANGAGIQTWLAARIGSKTTDIGFGWEDLVADIDGYLVDAMLRADPNRPLSDCIREIEYKSRAGHESWRFQAFVNQRFGGSWQTASSAGSSVFTASWANLPREAFLKVRQPTASEIAYVGKGFADALWGLL